MVTNTDVRSHVKCLWYMLVESSSGVVCFNVKTVTWSRSLPLGSAGSSVKRSVNETVNGLCQV